MSEIIRANVVMSLHSQVCINSWHLRVPDASDYADLLQDWVTGMIETQVSETPNTVTFQRIEYRRVDIDGTAGALLVPTGWPKTGVGTGSDLPSFCAILVKGVASGQPRPNRIRKFLPGILEGGTTASELSGTEATSLQDIITAWQAYIDAAVDPLPVAASYVSDPGPPPVVETNVGGRWNLITDISGTNTIAVMRSRKTGHGV